MYIYICICIICMYGIACIDCIIIIIIIINIIISRAFRPDRSTHVMYCCMCACACVPTSVYVCGRARTPVCLRVSK